MGYRMINGQAVRIDAINQRENFKELKGKKSEETKTSFQEILKKNLESNKTFVLSKHAEERLKGINFSEVDMKEIEKGFKIAEGKGAKNSMFLYKDVALIASIENKTLITAVEKGRARENCFTNIDSVVIL